MVPNESIGYDFLLVIRGPILTYLLSYTVSKLWLIIGHIFASERGVPHFNAANIAINDISLVDSLP